MNSFVNSVNAKKYGHELNTVYYAVNLPAMLSHNARPPQWKIAVFFETCPGARAVSQGSK